MFYYSNISLSSGIGQGRVTSNLEGAPIDWAILVKDVDIVKMV